MSDEKRTLFRERERLDSERSGPTRKLKITFVNEAGAQDELKIFATVNTYEDGRPGEIFLKADKQGTLISGLLDSLAMSMSLGLQYGVPLDAYTSKFVGMQFSPAGITGEPKFPRVTSIVDMIGRWLNSRFGKETET